MAPAITDVSMIMSVAVLARFVVCRVRIAGYGRELSDRVAGDYLDFDRDPDDRHPPRHF